MLIALKIIDRNQKFNDTATDVNPGKNQGVSPFFPSLSPFPPSNPFPFSLPSKIGGVQTPWTPMD